MIKATLHVYSDLKVLLLALLTGKATNLGKTGLSEEIQQSLKLKGLLKSMLFSLRSKKVEFGLGTTLSFLKKVNFF